MHLALVILILTYALLALQRIPRVRLQYPAGAVLSAVAIVASGVLPYGKLKDVFPLDLVLFLLGMLIISVYLHSGNAIEYFANITLRTAVTPIRLSLFFLVSGVLVSAFTLNITAALVLAPVVLTVAKRVNENPTPYLIALILGLNLGSAATAIGSPQSMMIVSMSGMSFWDYSTKMAVLVAVGTVVAALWLMFTGRKTLMGRSFAGVISSVKSIPPNFTGVSALVILLLVVIMMIFGMPMPVAAMIGASILLAINPQPPKDVLSIINWQLILFIASLFIIVGGFGISGAGEQAIALLDQLASSDRTVHIVGLTAFLATVSATFSNLPSAALISPLLQKIEHSHALWFATALATTFAGNLSLFGSLSNLAVIEVAKDKGYILSYRDFLRVGLPVGFLTLIIGIFYIVRM